MKKIVVITMILAIAAVAGTNAYGQRTAQERKQDRVLKREINRTEKDIKEMKRKMGPDNSLRIETLKEEVKVLKNDFLNTGEPVQKNQISQMIKVRENELISLENKIADRGKLEEELEVLEEKSSDLQLEKNTKLYYYVTNTDIPREVAAHTETRRKRGNNLRREELVLKKIENNLSSIMNGEGGLKVILKNDYNLPSTFYIYPTDGGEETSESLEKSGAKNSVGAPTDRKVIYLIPGIYSVACRRGSEQIRHLGILTIDGQKRGFRGEDCCNFAYAPIN
jgi:hypothetical protein